MPNLTKDQKLNKQLNKDAEKSNMALRGVSDSITLEDINLRDSVRQTTLRITQKHGERTNGKNLDTYTYGSLSKAVLQSKGIKTKNAEEANTYFKKFMEMNNVSKANDLIMADTAKSVLFANYHAMYKHIPELSKGLEIYIDNIISPDNFNKVIFDTDYKGSTDESKKQEIRNNVEKLISKYKLNKKIEKITRNSLLYGVDYVAVLSLERELDMMLSDNVMNNKMLNESLSNYDKNYTNVDITYEDLNLNTEQRDALIEFFKIEKKESKSLNESKRIDNSINEEIIKQINEKFQITSKLDLFKESLSAARETTIKSKEYNDYLTENINSKGKKKKSRTDNKPLYLSGSVIKDLDPRNVIDLELDGIKYGIFYIEYNDLTPNKAQPGDYPAMAATGYYGNVNQTVPSLGSTGTSANIPQAGSNSSVASKTYNVSQEKINLISDIFLKSLSQKIDKDFVRNNKDFKEFIYTMVKQEYTVKKQAKITYLAPDEYIKTETPPLYENIVYFAKLYLAMLTNLIIINLSRGHDKRVFYVNVGLDGNADQAIDNMIMNIKSKDLRMNEEDITTILNLNFGVLDDLFIPQISGNRPFDVDTFQGQDLDINNNSFLEYLKNSMINGMSVPPILLDMMTEIDFARTISVTNGAFARSIVKKQFDFQEPFTQFIQKLYYNEYKYNDDGDSKLEETTNIDKIEVVLHAPTTLLMQTISEQVQIYSEVAQTVAETVFPPKMDQSNDDNAAELKAFYLKNECKSIDWQKYLDYAENELKIKQSKEIVSKIKETIPDDGYSDY